MPTKKFTERFALLNGGRRIYLDFLRNLGPQSVLLAFTIVLWHGLEFRRFDASNWFTTSLFFLFLGATALAVYANSTIFYQDCFKDFHEWMRAKEAELLHDRSNRWMFFPKLALSVAREKWVEAFEVVTALFFLQVALSAVIVLASNTASTMIQTSSKHPVAASKAK